MTYVSFLFITHSVHLVTKVRKCKPSQKFLSFSLIQKFASPQVLSALCKVLFASLFTWLISVYLSGYNLALLSQRGPP